MEFSIFKKKSANFVFKILYIDLNLTKKARRPSFFTALPFFRSWIRNRFLYTLRPICVMTTFHFCHEKPVKSQQFMFFSLFFMVTTLHSGFRLWLLTGRYWVRIPAWLNVCHRSCAYIVLQTVQRPVMQN